MLIIRKTEQSACHWREQKSSQEQQLIDVNCLTCDVWTDSHPPWTIPVLLILDALQTFFFSKDLMDFHQMWWIRQKIRKLLPIWNNNFKWLIYVHIKTIRILIWICFLLCSTIIVTNAKQVLLFTNISVDKLYIFLTNRINTLYEMITISYWFSSKCVDLYWILPKISKWLMILITAWINTVYIHYLRIIVAEQKNNPFKWVPKFIINTENIGLLKTFNLEKWNKEPQNKFLPPMMK